MLTSSVKRIVIFSAIAGVCAGAAFIITQQRQSQFSAESVEKGSAYILSDSEREALNQIAALNISSGGDILTLTKAQDEIWRIVEKSDYPAEPSAIRAVLLGLSQAQRIEEKTTNPERYASLGLDNENAIQVEGLGATGEALFSLTLGGAPVQRGGMYAKRADEAATWLISEQMNLSVSFEHWTDKNLFSLSDSEITSAMIAPAESDIYTIAPRDINGLFAWGMDDIPAGYTVKNQSILRTVMSAAGLITIDDIAAEPEKRSLFSERYLGAVTYTLKDGAVIRVDIAQEPEDASSDDTPQEAPTVWLSFTVTPPPAAENPEDDTREGRDYGMMQEAAAGRVFNVSSDIIADIILPRSDILMLKQAPATDTPAIPPLPQE